MVIKMQKGIINKVVPTIWLLIIITVVNAGEVELSLDPELEIFVKQFRSAAQSRDVNQIRELSHTKSKTCVNSGNAEYYDRILNAMIRVFGHDQKIKNISYKTVDTKELENSMAQMLKQGMRWPVDPDGRVIVQYEKQGGARVANLIVAKERGSWRWVHVCKT